MFSLAELQDPQKFEELTFRILARTNPYKIDWLNGGRDRGRDIELYYEVNGDTKKVIVECKFYKSRSVNIQDLSRTIDWAKITRPNLLYFWINPYLTPDTKDYLKGFSENYGISTDWEDLPNIEEYLSALENGQNKVFEQLRRRIIQKISKSIISSTTTNLEYETDILKSDHHLVDRIDERKFLTDSSTGSFYIYGIAGVGKTQLLKNIAKTLYNSNYKIYWHSILIEDDPNTQMVSFLKSLANFFRFNFSDNLLENYFKDFGYFISQKLLDLLSKLFNAYKPKLFIDDFHKCKSQDLLTLLGESVLNSEVQIWFMAWFNVFDSRISQSSKIAFFEIKGLEKKYVEELYLYHHGYKPDNKILESLVQNYQSLPIYIRVAPKNDVDSLLERSPSYSLELLLKKLSIDEVDVIQVLSVSREPISISLIKEPALRSALLELVNKKIVEIIGQSCKLHDLLKEASRNYFLTLDLNQRVSKTLLTAGENNSGIIIDIINKYLINNNLKEAQTLFEQKFQNFLDEGYDLAVLEILNKLLSKDSDFNYLMIKKISILERLGEYESAYGLIQILDPAINSLSEYYEEWIYLKLRVLYFCSEFLEVIKFILNSYEQIKVFTLNIKLQILFIAGRCFYIFGMLEPAANIYVYIFTNGFGSDKALLLKVIHRMAMIEECLNFNHEASLAFETILSPDIGLTKKREAYALYRIAKCNLKMNNFSLAHQNNERSIEIKEGFNHQRGLVFSYKLSGKIYLREGQYNEALMWTEKSFKLAKSIGIKKEIVSTGISLMEIMITMDFEKETIETILNKIIPMAVEMNLYHRLKTIKNIVLECGMDFSEQIKIVSNFEAEMDALLSDLSNQTGQIHDEITFEFKQRIADLLEQKSAITPYLLTLASTRI